MCSKSIHFDVDGTVFSCKIVILHVPALIDLQTILNCCLFKLIYIFAWKEIHILQLSFFTTNLKIVLNKLEINAYWQVRKQVSENRLIKMKNKMFH